ncbi:sodium/calcium exchanger 1 [Salpingoeca rosetta]|uniref:Sodium/calcium exchanger 1 n=1 Tax=Salpingoeca rosetta (strain ATCC 50818 / BSB-021) TaxID=946362 RepID=F2TZB3_SALR5|nr:sodium/calcium exchanger 1 [Salpingoeca rosetta]EGD78937.1 sodium/calcium exchanger 1 [Salpingoeca rosetta]|eukprot:XP_004997893.1 sodium/calcium exchanger 1 [Salpingoeca rosetta]
MAATTTSAATTLSEILNNNNSTEDACDGLIIPYFGETNFGYFLIYAIVLAWLFVGIAISADYFMQAVEYITSSKKHIVRGDQVVTIHIWNATVANLTLMALGSSAPEILLSIVEVIGGGFQSGELGPGTIVGSAAFNMLIIVAVCVNINKTRRIKELYVFYCTTFFSVIAYVWLYLMVSVISPDEIEVWEGVVTVLFFPLLVGMAWMFDQKLRPQDRVASELRNLMLQLSTTPDKRQDLARAETHMEQEWVNMPVNRGERLKYRYRLAHALEQVNRTDPNLPAEEKYLRANAIVHRKLRNVDKLDEGQQQAALGLPGLALAGGEEAGAGQVGFLDSHIAVHKSSGKATLRVGRRVPSGESYDIMVKYKTVPGTAFPDIHYVHKEGVVMLPGSEKESVKYIDIELFQDTPNNRDKEFSVQLESATGERMNWLQRSITINVHQRPEADSLYDAIYLRWCSIYEQLTEDEEADTPYLEQIRCSLRVDGGGDDDDDDDDDEEEEDEDEQAGGDTGAGMKLATYTNDSDSDDDDTRYILHEDGYLIDETQTTDAKHSWGELALFSVMVLWNFPLAVLTPPAIHFGGWACFGMSLMYIGFFTALVADIATGLGCTVGLEDTVTAISFVALGTSVPDIFASKIAAEKQPYADDAVGNVTGSNAVNVFLGVGLAWLLGASYQSAQNHKFMVPAGALGFSVVVFCVFAVLWFAVILARRKFLGAELGGPRKWKRATVALFVGMWILYVLLSALVAYGHLPSF